MRLFAFSLLLAVALFVSAMFFFDVGALRPQLLWILGTTVGGASVLGLLLAIFESRHQYQRQNQQQTLLRSRRRDRRVSLGQQTTPAKFRSLDEPTGDLPWVRTESLPQDLPDSAVDSKAISLPVHEEIASVVPSLPVHEEIAPIVQEQSEGQASIEVSGSFPEEEAQAALAADMALHVPDNGMFPHEMEPQVAAELGIQASEVANDEKEAMRGPADQVLYLAGDFDMTEVQRVLRIWQLFPHTDSDGQQHSENLLGRWKSQDGTLIEVLHDKDGTPCIEIRGPMADELAEFLPQDLPVFPIPQRTNLV